MRPSRPSRLLERRLVHTAGRKIAFYTIAHNLSTLLVGGFEVALILRLTGSFERIVLFNLFLYILLYAAFVAGTYLLRTGQASRSFRFDLGFQAAGCAYLVLLFGQMQNPLVLGGFFGFKGVSEGLFWSTRHSALIHSVPDHARDRWSLALQSLTIASGIVLPVLSGFVISEIAWPGGGTPSALPVGYLPVYALAGLLALGCLLLGPRFTLPPQQVRWTKFPTLARTPGKADWMAYLSFGTVASITVALSVGILNFHVLGSEFRLGIFASWIALASAGFFLGIRFLVKRRTPGRLPLVLAGSAGELTSRLLFAAWPTVPGLVVKSLLDSFIVPLRSMFGENVIRRRVELLSAAAGITVAEAILFQETVLFAARVVGLSALAVLLEVVRLDPVAMARTLLGCLVGYSAVDFLLLRRIDRGNRRYPAGGNQELGPPKS